jgi:hypothetical protein
MERLRSRLDVRRAANVIQCNPSPRLMAEAFAPPCGCRASLSPHTKRRA